MIAEPIAAAIGAGTTGDNEPHLYLGTSSWVAAHVPAKKTDVVAGIAVCLGSSWATGLVRVPVFSRERVAGEPLR